MTRGESTVREELLKAALEGLEVKRARIEDQIREVESMLGQRRGRPPAAAPQPVQPSGGARQLSEAARRRIAAAQKRRWAEYRKTKKAA